MTSLSKIDTCRRTLDRGRDTAHDAGRISQPDERGARRSPPTDRANPAARGVSEKALGVLVFPNVVKAGFIFGGQSGQGILFYGDKPAGRYRTTAASYGLQAGAQKFGYALFFMNQKALDWVNAAHGWSIGSAPSLVVVDQGMARTMNTETLHSGIYAFTFDQRGLMGGIGIQGSKIQRLD